MLLQIPVQICLRETKFHLSRNGDLTNAFILSIIFGVFLRLPITSATVLETFNPNWNQKGAETVSMMTGFIDWEFFSLQTHINSTIFIFVALQKPIKRLFKNVFLKLKEYRQTQPRTIYISFLLSIHIIIASISPFVELP